VSASRGRLGVIFLTVLIDLIGFGIIIPILPYYAQRFGAHGLEYGVLMGSFSGMQFVANTVLGRLSDRVGRRPILLLTMVVNCAGYLVFAAAGSYGILLAARLVNGFASGNISVAYAYVADTTTPENRSRGMGIIGAAFGVGFVVGPLIGGLASYYLGHLAPGLVAAGLSALNLALAWRILPESLPTDRRTHRPLFQLGHIGEAFADRRLRALLVVWTVAPLAFAAYSTVLPLDVTARLHWNEKDLAWLFVVIGVMAAIVQGLVYGRLARVAGDRNLLVLGLLGMALGVAAVPFMPTSLALYSATAVMAFFNSLFAPAASGLVSLLADPTEQGATLGAAQSLGALGRLTGPEVFGSIYDHSGSIVTFVIAGAVMALGAGVAAMVPGGRPTPVRPEELRP
jgi:MFS transporter, DHA1 family, tetracycline resistance protein